MGSCLQALIRRQPFPASNIPVAVQRRVILASRQSFTDLPNDAVHGFDDVCAGQGAAQFERQAQPAPDQIVERRLDYGGVPRGSFDDAWWVFLTGNLNADSSDHQQTVVRTQPIDPDRHKVRLREIRSHALIEFGLRQRFEPSGYRRFGQAAARLGRNTGLGQPNGAAELTGGHIHHHQVLRH